MPGIARRTFVLGALALPAIATAAAASWAPDGPVTLIVPFAEGGTNDDVMRAIATAAEKRIGQPLLIQNKPGRGGVRSIAALASAQPDGRLIAQLPAAALRIALLEGIPFEAGRDATPILGLAGGAFGAIAKTGRFPEGWAGFLAEARDKPGSLSYGSPGVNSTAHLTMARLLLRERVRAVHVPFRGTMHGARAVLAGDVDIMAGPARIGALVQDGDAAWLHVWSAQRLPRWPDAPTLRELGYRLTVTAPFGIVAPPALAAEAVVALHDAFLRALRSAEVQAILERHDMTEDYRDGAAYTAFLAEMTRMEEMLIGRLGLQP